MVVQMEENSKHVGVELRGCKCSLDDVLLMVGRVYASVRDLIPTLLRFWRLTRLSLRYADICGMLFSDFEKHNHSALRYVITPCTNCKISDVQAYPVWTVLYLCMIHYI